MKKQKKQESRRTYLTFSVIDDKTIKFKFGRTTYVLDCSEENNSYISGAYGNAAGLLAKKEISLQSKIWKALAEHLERVENE
tara:strand:+ start:189 stop:434 length:246 start_codon:yes stop_codon:yes gene_type:complete